MITMLKENKKAVIGAVILVVIAGFSVNALTKKEKVPVDTTPIEEVVPEVPAPIKKPVVKPTPVQVVETRTYTEVSAAYKNKTVQFNNECGVAIFPQTVFKTGTDVLLDNRGATSATVSFAGATFTLPAYGFKVVSLDKAGSFTVDCNSQKNVATLIVQK